MRKLAVVLGLLVLAGGLALLLWSQGQAPIVEPLPPLPPRVEPEPPPPPPAEHGVRTLPRPTSPRERPTEPPVRGTEPVAPPRPDPQAPPGEGELPEDELGTGDCVLTVRLLDDATGEGVESAVRLWRRGVPASEKWTGGDHVQRRVFVPDTGVTLEHLPAGTYRVEIDGASRAADDPAEFTLDGEQVQKIRVSMPKAVPIRCVVVNENGVQLGTAEHRTGSIGSGTTQPRPAPVWAAPRQRTAEKEGTSPYEARRVAQGSALFSELSVSGQGFELGTIRETTHTTAFTQADELRFPGSNSVVVLSDGDTAAAGGYLAVAVPIRTLVERVRLPEGYPLPPNAAIVAECRAVPHPANAPGDEWRKVPVRVKVTLEGYEPLEYFWSVSAPPVDTMTLVPMDR